MEYYVEMGSDVMIRLLSYVKIGSVVQKVKNGEDT
jgi:hypothetical protein